MYIHIDTLGVHRDIEEERRITLLGNKFLVGLRYRLVEIWRAEISAIYEHILLARIVACRFGATDIALHRSDGRFDIDFEQVASCGISHNSHNALYQRRLGQRVDGCAVVQKRTRHLRVAECHATELALDVRRERRLLAIDEFASCRGVVEEVAHQELRTHRGCNGCLRHELATIDNGLRAHLAIGLTGDKLHLRYCRDGGQGLASETEGVQGVDVVERRNLARCVALEGHACIHRRHSATVVDNLHKVATAIHEVYGNLACAGINGILHHLLHNG